MHSSLLLVVAITVAVITASSDHIELLPYSPRANSDAIITSGSARFTVLTNSVIRIEYDRNRQFEDRATLAFVNRATPVPKFKTYINDEILTIQTQTITLTYVIDNEFSCSTLNVSSSDNSWSWCYGQFNDGIQMGTLRSLDDVNVQNLNCTEIVKQQVHNESMHCEWGLVSRAGWVLVNDSDNFCLTDLTNTSWWDGRNHNQHDLYLFGHGLNYRQALRDFVAIAGRAAMVPRYMSGIMWSRWFNLNDKQVKRIVSQYKNNALPLDVFVLDMDWHTKEGWGGYTWDKRMFPVWSNTLGYLKGEGLAIGANLHDNDGIRPTESRFEVFREALGLPADFNETIPLSLVNASYMYALEDLILWEIEKAGMDFWWTDWQQGGDRGGVSGGKDNPTFWLNRMRGTDKLRRGDTITRGLTLARFGGLGNHRYQVGFSGDVANLTWANMRYQPFFTMSGTNVAYGTWSHDLVGPHDDLELYTRWLQWIAWSPIFRTHDRGLSSGQCNNYPASCGIVEVWNVPEPHVEIHRVSMRKRAMLLPYIYNAQFQLFDTGLSIMRPMYYDFPAEESAYLADQDGNYPQYMFGDDILVSPMVTPADVNSSIAAQKVWLPPNTAWYYDVSGQMMYGDPKGGSFVTVYVDLAEVPIFYRAGSIIATHPIFLGDSIGVAARQYTHLEFVIYPGESKGATQLYEDDGSTTNYATKCMFGFTDVSYTRDKSSVDVLINTTGGYPEMPPNRFYSVRFVQQLPPPPGSAIYCNGEAVSHIAFQPIEPIGEWPSQGGWYFDGESMSVVVRCPQVAKTDMYLTRIKVPLWQAPTSVSLDGFKGYILRSNMAKQVLDDTASTPGGESVGGGLICSAASLGQLLSVLAANNTEKLGTLVEKFDFQAVIDEIDELNTKPSLVHIKPDYKHWLHAMTLLKTAVLSQKELQQPSMSSPITGNDDNNDPIGTVRRGSLRMSTIVTPQKKLTKFTTTNTKRKTTIN